MPAAERDFHVGPGRGMPGEHPQIVGKIRAWTEAGKACVILQLDGPDGPVGFQASVPIATIEKALGRARRAIPPAKVAGVAEQLAKRVAVRRLEQITPPGLLSAVAAQQLVRQYQARDKAKAEGEKPVWMEDDDMMGLSWRDFAQAVPGVSQAKLLHRIMQRTYGGRGRGRPRRPPPPPPPPEDQDAEADDQAPADDSAGMGFLPALWLAKKFGPKAARFAVKNPHTMVAAGKMTAAAKAGDPKAKKHIRLLAWLSRRGHPGAKKALAAAKMTAAAQAAAARPARGFYLPPAASRPTGWSLRQA